MTPRATVRSISVVELYRLCQAGSVDLIDVRTPEEFAEVHACGARNIPLAVLDPAALVGSRPVAAGEPMYFICAVGARSAWVCQQMLAAGFPDVVNVEGGTQAWVLQGLPAEWGQGDITSHFK